MLCFNSRILCHNNGMHPVAPQRMFILWWSATLGDTGDRIKKNKKWNGEFHQKQVFCFQVLQTRIIRCCYLICTTATGIIVVGIWTVSEGSPLLLANLPMCYLRGSNNEVDLMSWRLHDLDKQRSGRSRSSQFQVALFDIWFLFLFQSWFSQKYI